MSRERSTRCGRSASSPTCSRPGSTSTARRSRQHFGVERLSYFHPYRTLAEQGVTVGGGSDHMQKIGSLRSINPYNPFLGMWTTIVRQPRGAKTPLHPEQTLTREQAIRLYTINNAFLTFEEAHKGSLEPGKLADFIVLDRDILTCPVEQVKDIQVEATYLGGARVYARPGKRWRGHRPPFAVTLRSGSRLRFAPGRHDETTTRRKSNRPRLWQTGTSREGFAP